LLALAIVCAIASCGIDRFGYEACHRGLPLAALMIGTPLAGMLAAAAAFIKRSRAWLVAITLAAFAVNGVQLATAIVVMTGVGIASC